MGSRKIQMVEYPDRDNFQSFAFRNASSGHGALGAAYQSYNIGRSTNSATILLLGLSGSGKSHTINNLFSRQISAIGDRVSVTRNILEFTINMPSEDLGISNAKLIIIDTPGFGDTEGGIAADAQVLANINQLFQQRKHKPNFIILTVNITDKRLEGEFAPFVKLLQATKKQLSGTVLDIENKNLIVVLTHFCSLLPKRLQRDPTSKKEIVKRLVHEYIGIPDVNVEVAENMFEDNELEKVGDYYKLPNGDLFTRNIYQSMINTAKGIDPIGQGIVNEAYPKLPNGQFQVIQRDHRIENIASAAAVAEDIMRMQISTASEIGDRLMVGWNELTPTEQNGCRMKPTELAMKLTTLGYKQLVDLPKAKKDVITFFRDVAPDKNMQVLLQKSLGLEASTLNFELLIGSAFDLPNDRATTFKVLEPGSMQLAPVGCLLPMYVDASVHNEVKFTCNVTNSTGDMTRRRLQELKINVNIGSFNLNFGQRDGYNVFTDGSSNTMTAVYEKHLMKLEIRRNDAIISNELKSAVTTLPFAYDKHNKQNVEKWKTFFNTYGTHYINTSYIGGSVLFKIANISNSTGNSNINSNQGGISAFLGSIFSVSVDYSNTQSSSSSNSLDRRNFEIIVKGGNSSKASNLALSSTKEQFIQRLEEWEKTIWEDPTVTDSSIGLGEVADVVNSFYPNVVNGMKNAAQDLYKASLKYEPLPPEPTKDKDSQDNKPGTGGCITADTLISTPTVPKTIASLKQGDIVLNKSGQPTRVIGVNKVYSYNNGKLYGFKHSSATEKPFFTSGHTFLHPSGDILVQKKSVLEQSHPQMKTEFTVKEMPMHDIEILTFEGKQLKRAVVPGITSADMVEDEELYFMIVEGDGTYIANGFVCYHELPKFEAWPITFATIFESVKFVNPVNNNRFTREDFNKLMKLSIDIMVKWQILIKTNITSNNEKNTQNGARYLERALSHFEEIISNSFQVNLGMMLYSLCGELLHRHLDVEGLPVLAFVETAREVLAPISYV